MSAPTVAVALSVIEAYGHVRAPHVRFVSRGNGRRVVLEVRPHLPLPDGLRQPVLEALMISLHDLLAAVAGTPLYEASFHFPWPAPGYASYYAEVFDGAVHFAAPRLDVTLPLLWLCRPCPTADGELYAQALRQLEVRCRRQLGGGLMARIGELIAAGPTIPSLQEVADLVHMSTRTVIRHLRRAGTNYQELVDTHRREQAERLLADPALDVAEIAYGLGYADPANFGRACRRWFGVAPSFYRERRDYAPSPPIGRSSSKRRKSN
jgi:AraC-like DNA-binding protein